MKPIPTAAHSTQHTAHGTHSPCNVHNIQNTAHRTHPTTYITLQSKHQTPLEIKTQHSIKSFLHDAIQSTETQQIAQVLSVISRYCKALPCKPVSFGSVPTIADYAGCDGIARIANIASIC